MRHCFLSNGWSYFIVIPITHQFFSTFLYKHVFYISQWAVLWSGIGCCQATSDVAESVVISCPSSTHISLHTNGQSRLLIVMDCFVCAGEFWETHEIDGVGVYESRVIIRHCFQFLWLWGTKSRRNWLGLCKLQTNGDATAERSPFTIRFFFYFSL
jgi:hypothetical protein